MPSQVATAYVQIIPSAQGIGNGIAQALGGDSAAASAGKSIGGQLVGTIKGAIATAGIGAALGKALTEGAALEQSLGGVETLFKDSAGKVIANAEKAYATAGVSANSYMEQVTSFSATLLQGLGGDTEAAAKVADQAIIQMSDNANKMGTSIGSIQYAYQGFAKDNYTMLDNLKLGYGGTQAEMARLVNESGVLGDAIQVTDQTVRDVPFDKIIEAIGVIQDRLGITGTTALEAATTLSGSFAAMQAAASNVLANLALGRDIQPSLNALAETVTTFLVDNLLPAVWNILSALPGALATFVQALVPRLKDALLEGVRAFSPELGAALESAFGFLAQNGNAIAAALVSIASAFTALKALNLATTLGSSLVTFVSALRSAGSLLALAPGVLTAFLNPVGLVVAAVAGLAAGFLYLWNTCEPFRQFWVDLGTGILNFVSSAGQTLTNFFTVTLPATFTGAIATVTAWATSMLDTASQVGAGFVNAIVTFFSQLPYNLGVLVGTALATVVNWSSQMLGAAQQMGSSFLTAVVTFFAQLPTNIQAFVSAAWAYVSAWVPRMVQSASQMGAQFLASVGTFFSQLPGNVARFLTSVLTAVAAWVTSMGQKASEAASEFGRLLLDGLASLPDRVVSVGQRIVEGLWSGITGAGGWLKNQISGFVSGVVDGFKANFSIHSPSQVMADQVGRFIPAGIATGMVSYLNPLRSAISTVSDTLQSGFSGQLSPLRSAIAAGTPRPTTARTSTDASLLDAIQEAAMQIVEAIRENGGDLYIGDDVIGRANDRYRLKRAVITGGRY